ncbi:MAG: serine hydrolase domain-containing protein [Pseudomonadales bacterium]
MKVVILVLSILVWGSASAADLDRTKPSRVGMSAERLERIKPVMQQYIDEGKLAGITTVVARKGKIVQFETVGKLNLDTGEPLGADSLFRIYSMTKPIVTTAAMILHEEGKFNLNDPVAKYLPAFKDTKVLVDGQEVDATHQFTIRELMSHTAGLTYGIFGDTEVDKAYREANILRNEDLEEMVEALGQIPLQYQPGTRWHYSVSVDVLGRLIEVVAGQPLDEFLEARIFAPLGMQDTFFEVPTSKVARFGTNHVRNKEGELTVMDRPETSNYTKNVTFFSGGGGLVSTAMDYIKYSQMMLNGGELNGVRIVSPKTVEIMSTNHLGEGVTAGFGERPGAVGSFGFGLGFSVATEPPLTTLGSEGEINWGGAAGTIFWIDPEEELTAVLMVQMMRNPYPLRTQFKNLVYQAVID